jgi:hypothetical protein
MIIATRLVDLINNTDVSKIEILTTKDKLYAICYINNQTDKPLFLNKLELTILNKGGQNA